jgi:hypothetical protein
MANTTFSGPVRSENGFESITKNATTGAITVNSSYGNVVVASTQALSGAGAANITTAITECTATATGNVVTLANGVAGQIKTITMVAEAAGTDTIVITPATFAGGTTVTLDGVGEAATFQYNATIGWVLLNTNGGVVA